MSNRTKIQPKPSRRRASRPIRILHVLGSMSRAGIQLRTLELLRHLDRRQYGSHFCLLSGRPGDLDHEVRALGGQVHLMREGLPGFPGRFRELIRRQQFDVVHAHLHYYSGYLLGLAMQCGTPVRVAHFRSSHPDPPPALSRRLLRALLRPCVDRYASLATMRGWLDRHATNILGVSRWALRSAWGPDWRSDPRCQVVYDGLEPADFAGTPEPEAVRREFGVPADATLYVHVGRITEAKNHLRLIAIFSEVLRHQPTARLLLIGRNVGGHGAGTIERRIWLRIAELGIAGHVICAGERTDVPRLIKAADVLIFPSLWEGLGDVVLEACAAGTPVLASELPSIREIAARLPGIRRLSLDEPDRQWARLAVEMANTPSSPWQRQAALGLFADSEFTVQRCTETLSRIWQGTAERQDFEGTAHG